MAKNKAMLKKKPIIKDNKQFAYVVLALLSVFIIITPFYRGLFFRENYVPAIGFVSLLYFAYLVYKFLYKDYEILDTYLDLAVLAIPICYFISFLFGVNAKDAFDAVLKYTSYFMIYRIAASICRKDEKIKNILINAVIITTFAAAFASILTLAKIIDLNGVVGSSRLFGIYQYPNTTASVLAVGIILTVNAVIHSDKLNFKLIYQVALTTLLSTFIFTLSRGAYLAIAAVMLLNFFLIDAKRKLRFILNLFISFASNSMFIYKYYAEGQAESPNIMSNYILSIAAALALTYIIHIIYKKYLANISNKAINIFLITIVVIFTAVLAFLLSVKEPIEYKIEHGADEKKSWRNKSIYVRDIEKEQDYYLEFDVMSSSENPHSYGVIIRSYNEKDEYEQIYKEFNPVGQEFEHKIIEFTTLSDTDRLRIILYNYETGTYTVYKNIVLKDYMGNIIKKVERFKYIPDAIANRFANIRLDDNSASSRVQFTKDAIKIFKDYLLIGAGGGGWKNLYRQYQSLPYNTTEVHNFYVQYAVEVGLLGLIPLAFILIHLLIGFINSIRNKSNYLSIYLAVILMLMHSAIDFNLSLVAVAYILWLLIGIINTDSGIKKISLPQRKHVHIVLILFTIIIFAFSASITYAINLGNKAAKLIQTDTNKSLELYEKAISFDKYNSDYRVDYAQIMNNKFKQTKDVRYYNNMLEQVAHVRKYEPYNYKYVSILINLFTSNGIFDEAVEIAEDRLEHEPLVSQSYVLKVDLNYEIAKYYFDSSQHGKAIPHLQKMIEAKNQFEEVNSKLEKPIKLPKDYNMKTNLAINWIEQAKRIEDRKSE